MTKSILLVGVGGQGTLLASKILTLGLMEAGFDVKMSEIHGMSQRGGSVSSHVRYGDKVFSPVIELGSADIIVSFEQMEALRSLEYLKTDGKIIVNEYRINPMPVLSMKAKYAEDILEELKTHAQTFSVNATQEAIQLGNVRTMNIILLGATVKLMGLDDIDWGTIIRNNVKSQFVEINIRALKRGMDLVG